MDWKMLLGITFWNALDLGAIVVSFFCLRAFVWKPFLDHFDLNKDSIR